MRLGMGELIVVLLIILILFGAKRLPEIAASLRRAVKEFRKAGKEIEEETQDDENKDSK